MMSTIGLILEILKENSKAEGHYGQGVKKVETHAHGRFKNTKELLFEQLLHVLKWHSHRDHYVHTAPHPSSPFFAQAMSVHH
jgi:hypothetical protein